MLRYTLRYKLYDQSLLQILSSLFFRFQSFLFKFSKKIQKCIRYTNNKRCILNGYQGAYLCHKVKWQNFSTNTIFFTQIVRNRNVKQWKKYALKPNHAHPTSDVYEMGRTLDWYCRLVRVSQPIHIKAINEGLVITNCASGYRQPALHPSSAGLNLAHVLHYITTNGQRATKKKCRKGERKEIIESRGKENDRRSAPCTPERYYSMYIL